MSLISLNNSKESVARLVFIGIPALVVMFLSWHFQLWWLAWVAFVLANINFKLKENY